MDDHKFVSYILTETPKLGHRAWLDAYDSLRQSPSQVALFLSRRENSSTFLAGIETYGSRIASFMQQLSQYSPHGQQSKEDLDVKKGLTSHIIRRVLLPLLANHHLQDRDVIFELLISVIHLSDRHALDLIAARVGQIRPLLAKLISDDRSARFLRSWTTTEPATMRDWTTTAVDLADQCVSDHGIKQELDRWRAFQELIPYLSAENRRLQSSAADSSHHGIRTTGKVDLPTPALALLETFGLSAPTSGLGLQDKMAYLEGPETSRIMAAVIGSFPCRFCFQRGLGNGAAAQPGAWASGTVENRLDGADLDSFEGLLGTGLGVWKISLSTQAMKDLRHSKREGNFHHIREKLEALASGDWMRRSVAKPVGDETGRFRVRVFQAWYGKNGRILWQVDVGFDEKHGSNCQIVRVWRLGDVKEIWASLDSVARAQQAFSTEKVTACKMNLVVQGRKTPVVFGDSESKTLEDCDPKTTDERTPQDILITGKFHTLTSTVLDSVLHDQDGSDFPFDVTGKEVEIIKHFRTATFILGRSGTGKTSCLLYKLLSRYLVQNLTASDKPIRQLLLTRSENLARKLDAEVRLLIDSQLMRVKVRTGAFDVAADDQLADDDRLADDDQPVDCDQPEDGDEDDAFEIEHAKDGMDENTTEDLFSLQKEDFPLVCTFGHFLKRLENSINANRAAGTGRLVDFLLFNAAYWQKSTSLSRAGFEPDLVFAEILGIIKGTTSYIAGFHPLTRDDYRAMSSRLAPTFATEANRDRMYDIYEAYETKKKRNGDYDAIDRVKVVLDKLTGNSVLNGLFEEVYVDEVQDQRPLEIELLLNLVNNPLGIHFAGDSAQCISKDSTFRFANLKALFYEHFSRTGNSFKPHLAKPELFLLSTNFRSHQGILSLASFVMDLLWRGFPDMVDKLSPEIGQYLGPKPVVFVGSDIAGLLELASRPRKPDRDPAQEPGNTAGPSEMASGSPRQDPGEQTNTKKHRQIVIVRDQKLQHMLQAKLGDGSVVFTILECKGMEYDDVFLFDFFSGSPCLSGYRSLEELLRPFANPEYGATHMTMCSELKNLYVAITRPRNRLWILESGSTFMLQLFTTKVPEPLVDVRFFDETTLPELVDEVRPIRATSEREWIDTGEQCMERRLFDQALKCFKNANNTRRILWAEGSIAELKGRVSEDPAESKFYISEASRFFYEIGMKERAAGCMETIGDFGGAAEIWAEKRQHVKAAGLFNTGKLYHEAAKQYHKAGMTSKALQTLYSRKVFDQLVRDLHRYRDNIEDGERMVYARECNILLRQPNSPIDAEHWVETFNTFITDIEKEDFLLEFNHGAELVEFYLTRGRVDEAFRYPVKQGEFDKGLEMLFDREGGANLTQIGTELELSELLKYTQTNKLLVSLSRGARTNLEMEARFSGAEWSRPWAQLSRIVNSYFKPGIMPERKAIRADPWITEYLDIIVSMRMEYFIRSVQSLTDFPLEYLHGLVDIRKRLSEHEYGMPLPPSLLVCYGVIPIPGARDSYLVLAWSKLEIGPNRSRRINGDRLSRSAIAYTAEIIGNAMKSIEQRARELWVGPEDILRCKSCVFRASWSRPNKTTQTCSHEIPSAVQFRITVQGLMTLCAFWQTLRDVQPLPGIDEWLSKLETLITFNSSFVQDAEVTLSMSQILITSPIYSNIVEQLRLSFSRRPELNDDFPSLLDNYRLGLTLGTYDAEPNQISKNRQLQKTPRKLPTTLPYTAFAKYQRLHRQSETHPEQFSAGVFCDDVYNLVQDLEKLRKGNKRISGYNGSVISVYEDILTFLIFSSKTRDVMIPKSWTKLYLPQWEPVLRATTELERCCYQQSMLRLVASFCDMVAVLESSHKGSEKSTNDEVLIRRSANLLVVSLINIGTITPPPLRYNEIWGKLQKAFTHPRFKMEETREVLPHQLPEHLARAVQIYNGKEKLLLYIAEHKVPRWYEGLDGAGIQLVALPIRPRRRPVFQNLEPTIAPEAPDVEEPNPTLLQFEVSLSSPEVDPTPQTPAMASAPSATTTIHHQAPDIKPSGVSKSKQPLKRPEGALLHAGFLIQALRRRQLAQRSRDQVHRATTPGRLIATLHGFCAAHRDQKHTRAGYLEFVATMVTTGLELYMHLNTTMATLALLREETGKQGLVASELRTAELDDYERRTSTWLDLFRVPAVFELNAEELEIQYKTGIEAVNTLNVELERSMERLQAERKEMEMQKTASNKKGKGKKKRGAEVGVKVNEVGQKGEEAEGVKGGGGGKKAEAGKGDNIGSGGGIKKEGESSKTGAGGDKELKPTEQQKGGGKQPGKGGSSAGVPWTPSGGGRRNTGKRKNKGRG